MVMSITAKKICILNVHCVTLRLTYCLHHSCSAALCPDPADIVNGMMTFTGNSVGDTATYNCNLGFELIGNTFITCTQVDMNIATFASAAPVCRREYCMIVNRIMSLP